MTDLTNTSVHLACCKLATMDQSMMWPVTFAVPEVQLSAGASVFLFCRRVHTESVDQTAPSPDYCRLFPQYKNPKLEIGHAFTFTHYIDFLGSSTSTSPLHLFQVLIKRPRTLCIVLAVSVTCWFSRMCYVESFAWPKLPFWFLWNMTALYIILMDLIYIFLHSSDSSRSSYLSVKRLVFAWLQYCSAPSENEVLAYLTQIQNSRSVISSVFLLVFFLID